MVIAIRKANKGGFSYLSYRNFPPSKFSWEKQLQASGRIEEHVAFQSHGHALRSLLELELFASVFELPLGDSFPHAPILNSSAGSVLITISSFPNHEGIVRVACVFVPICCSQKQRQRILRAQTESKSLRVAAFFERPWRSCRDTNDMAR